MSKEAMRQALEELNKQRIFTRRLNGEPFETTPVQITNAITALLQALAEPEQEPVAWNGGCALGHCCSPSGCEDSGRCRASAPAPRKPVDLTDKEIRGICEASGWDISHQSIQFAHAIIAAYEAKQRG